MEPNCVGQRVETVAEEVEPLKATNDTEHNGPDTQRQIALQTGNDKKCDPDEGVPPKGESECRQDEQRDDCGNQVAARPPAHAQRNLPTSIDGRDEEKAKRSQKEEGEDGYPVEQWATYRRHQREHAKDNQRH
jgi:hypothetical protein